MDGEIFAGWLRGVFRGVLRVLEHPPQLWQSIAFHLGRAQNNYLRPACHYDRPQHKMTDPGLALPAILQRSK